MILTDAAPEPLADAAAGVLDAVRKTRAARDREDARLLALAVEWAVLHPAESVDQARVADRWLHADRPVLLAGPGTPQVGEFAIAELAAALRLPTEAGRDLLADALSCATGCRGCDGGCGPGTCQPGEPAGSPTPR